MVRIRPWTEGDIEYVAQSISRERWGHTRRDVERCLHWEPKGCFVAEEGSEKVGHISTIGYRKLGWIGLLIVNPERRGEGIGTALMRTAVDYLHQTGVETIRLEAEEAAVPLYRRLGFREEFASMRYGGRAGVEEQEFHRQEISQVERKDISALVALDSEYFGADRSRVLKALFEGDQRQCFVANRSEPSGYIMCRRTQNGHWMGPWICKDSAQAEKLLNAALSSIGGRHSGLRFGFPSSNVSMLRLMKKKNFSFKGKSIRMFLGENRHRGIPHCVFGIGGPEKG